MHDASQRGLLFICKLQVLGTFIAEHDVGADVCKRAFATPETAYQTAAQLAAVAAAGGFEGWLINLEVELEASFVPNIIFFLTCALIPDPSTTCTPTFMSATGAR